MLIQQLLFLVFFSASELAIADLEVTVDDTAVRVKPVSRYVTREPWLRGYNLFLAALRDGKALYDDTYRHPYLPLGPLHIDCQETGRVGVVLLVLFPPKRLQGTGSRYLRNRSKDVLVKFFWTHTGHKEDESRYFTKHRAQPKAARVIVSDGLMLQKKDRVDGTISVNIVVDEESVYRTSYELVGCEE